MLRDAERRLELGRDALEELERRRIRFLRAFRQLLARELDGVDVEDARAPLENRPIDLDLGGGRFSDTQIDPSDAEQEADSEEAPADANQALLITFDADEDDRA